MTVTMTEKGEFESVSGNTCPRGAAYARQECTLPLRMITAVIPVAGSDVPLSVRTTGPVPRDMIRSVMRELSNVRISIPVRIGQVIISDVLHTGSDIIATRNLI